MKQIKYFQATAVMIGYIIGVGMFGLPFLVVKAGLIPFLVLFLLLVPVQYLLHLIYSTMILEVDGYHRLPGYTEMYLGKKWKMVIFIGKTIGNIGALLAYTIISGIFLNALLEPILGNIGSEFIYGSIIFFIEAIIVYLGVGAIAKSELVMTAILIFVVGLIVFRGALYIEAQNFTMIDWRYFILPYGALLFSLDGAGSLPIVARLVNKDQTAMKRVVRYGTFIAAIVTLIFTLTIAGISGTTTTPDALTGLGSTMNGILNLALVFGLFCMATSFFGVAQTIKETLNWDFKINKTVSWALAVFIPYGLYVIGVEDLTKVITFVGSIGGGICAIVLVIIFNKIRKAKKNLGLFNYQPPIMIQWFLIFLFLMGMGYTLWGYLIK